MNQAWIETIISFKMKSTKYILNGWHKFNIQLFLIEFSVMDIFLCYVHYGSH